MTAEPVAALHVLGRAGIQWLAEAEHGDEDPRAMDLAGLHVKPLDRIAGVIDFDAFAGGELTSSDARLPILRELMTWTLPASTGQLCQIARCVGHSITEQEE
jgi:hypothetical protein